MGQSIKERLGDYELVSLLGDGAQGRVYQARCVSTGNRNVAEGEMVALKVLRLLGDSERIRHKFHSQAEALRKLNHPNIIRYREHLTWHKDEWDEAQCLVMDFFAGETLHERLQHSQKPLPWGEARSYFLQSLAGLIYAGSQGITHRDIKPSNIFLAQKGQALLIDFDIARLEDNGHTTTCGWKGTLDYMAPDFITLPDFHGDEISDIFSLGICFYEAITGRLPFPDLGTAAHIGYIQRWQNEDVHQIPYNHPIFQVLDGAREFIERSSAKKREQRYQSFTAMLAGLEKIQWRKIGLSGQEPLYELTGCLGRGGFGDVFQARRLKDDTTVAIKQLLMPSDAERFLKEAEILRQHNHPNLVKYLDFLEIEQTYLLVLEHLPGMPEWSLSQRIETEGSLKITETVPLFLSYLAALKFLHEAEKPIIHRDLKPANLYAPPDNPGGGKIFDLGIARDLSSATTGRFIPGTLDYMAPELIFDPHERGSAATDSYALGLCLYEAISGQPAYPRLPDNPQQAWELFRVSRQVMPPLELPVFAKEPQIRQVLAKALALSPHDRYQNASQMIASLQELIEKNPPPEVVTTKSLVNKEPEGHLANSQQQQKSWKITWPFTIAAVAMATLALLYLSQAEKFQEMVNKLTTELEAKEVATGGHSSETPILTNMVVANNSSNSHKNTIEELSLWHTNCYELPAAALPEATVKTNCTKTENPTASKELVFSNKVLSSCSDQNLSGTFIIQTFPSNAQISVGGVLRTNNHIQVPANISHEVYVFLPEPSSYLPQRQSYVVQACGTNNIVIWLEKAFH